MLALVILGGMAVLAVPLMTATSATRVPSVPRTVAPSDQRAGPRPGHAPSEVQAAAVVACRSDYAAVVSAASDYQAVHGTAPRTVEALDRILKDPVTSRTFAITIDPTNPGQVEVAVPGHPTRPGDSNCDYVS